MSHQPWIALPSIPALLLFAASGCALASPSARSAIDRAEVVASASFDHDCPKEDVLVLERADGDVPGTQSFLLDVCGTPRRYRGVGSIYFEAPLATRG